MDLSIIIVSWNCKEELLNCVDSVLQHPYSGSQEVIVVDNASSDGTVEAVRTRFPHVYLVETGANWGFGRAANLGMRMAQGTFLLMLNPDVVVPAEVLDAALRFLREQPAVGILGVGLRNSDGSPQPSCGQFLSLSSLIGANLRSVIGTETTISARGRGMLWASGTVAEVDWLSGAFMLGLRAVFTTIGGFDEEYFLYAEDMDLCYRVRQQGYAVVYWPTVAVTHLGNRSGAQKWAERREGEIVRAELLFLCKHRGLLSAVGFRIFGGGLFFCKGVGAWLQALRRKEERTVVARRYWHMAKVCLGWE